MDAKTFEKALINEFRSAADKQGEKSPEALKALKKIHVMNSLTLAKSGGVDKKGHYNEYQLDTDVIDRSFIEDLKKVGKAEGIPVKIIKRGDKNLSLGFGTNKRKK